MQHDDQPVRALEFRERRHRAGVRAPVRRRREERRRNCTRGHGARRSRSSRSPRTPHRRRRRSSRAAHHRRTTSPVRPARWRTRSTTSSRRTSHAYETWGRTIELKFVQSSGDDEAAQRADALRVEDHKPFAVLETTPTGLDVLTTKVAQDGYLVMSNTTTTDKAFKQQPYRWGQADQVSVAVNAGEFVGKQLVGKKAEYAGERGPPEGEPRARRRVPAGGVRPPEVVRARGREAGRKDRAERDPRVHEQRHDRRRSLERAGAGADDGREAQGPRRHDGRDVHRRRDGQGDDRAGDQARVPARVDHRRIPVPGPRPPRAVVRPGSMGARVRHLEPVPLRRSPPTRARRRRSMRCSGTTDEATARRVPPAGHTSPGSWPVSSTPVPISR